MPSGRGGPPFWPCPIVFGAIDGGGTDGLKPGGGREYIPRGGGGLEKSGLTPEPGGGTE